jgi:hypothetical protein
MGIPDEAYRALEDVVGPQNVSREPVILDSYAYQYMAECFRPEQSKFTFRAEAAILPANTEEVQAVVRTCNRFRLKLHAYSTGWGSWGGPQCEGVIQMDMRRMNHILEIDKNNMFAIVEPYVICAQLQSEAMKVGLNSHMIGAGASCSVVGNIAAFGGPGPDTIFMGNGPDNLLGLEWVMPDGEILRTGSLGSVGGWFCGEGPGPSLRGLARGPSGVWGGLGVITKCAARLHPWPGPAVMPIEGTVPIYKSAVPDNFRSYTLAFPDWQSYTEAHYKLYDSEIGYIAHRQFIQWGDELQAAVIKIVTDPTKQMCDLEELLKEPEVQKLTKEMERSFQLILAGMTIRDIEYQDQALKEILKETGGWKVRELSEPEMEKWTFLYMTKMCYKNMNWLYSGEFSDTMIAAGTPDMLYPSGLNEAARKILKGAKGGIVDLGSDSGMGAIDRGMDGGVCGIEPFVFYDPHDPQSTKEAIEVMREGAKFGKAWDLMTVAGTYGLCLANLPKAVIQSRPAFHWQRRIREVLDPHGLGDGSYICAEELKAQGPG